MNENQINSGNLLDTTDCLEAVGVFKGWKNFFFIILLLCILLLQACFWVVDLGVVPVPAGAASNTKVFTPMTSPNVSDSNNTAGKPAMLTAEPNLSSPNDVSGKDSSNKESMYGITFEHVVWTIRFTDAVCILITALYCMTILFSLKVSMLGRLGGINHITKAFFLSLIMFVLVLPWQKVFDGVVMGAIFTPNELVKWQAAKTGEMFDMILYYMRFCGYMVLVFLLLLMAQIRGAKWAKAILRRLEII